MNWSSWLVWGFASTIVLTSIVAASQGFGITRMNIPYLLGTMLTPDRDRAKFIGIILHFAKGWIFSLVYVAAFQVKGKAKGWFGGWIGVVQSLLVFPLALPPLPARHLAIANVV